MIDPNSINRVHLGQSCPECPPDESHRYVYAQRSGSGVFMGHNKCGWGKRINMSWEGYVKEKIAEGYVEHPKAKGTLIGQWDLEPWMFEHSRTGGAWSFIIGGMVLGGLFSIILFGGGSMGICLLIGAIIGIFLSFLSK